MQRTIIGTLFLFCFSLSAQAADPWTPTQKALGAVSTALLVLDWRQTLTIADHPEQWQEENVIEGQHPTRRTVNLYHAVVIPGNLLIAHWLPSQIRTQYLAFVTFIEVDATYHNYKIGIRASF